MTEKEGFTVKELQQRGKRYAVEIALVIIFALSAIFALVWGAGMMVWSIILAMAFAIVGAVIPKYMDRWIKASMGFLFKQQVVGVVMAVVFIVLAIFVPVVTFALLMNSFK